MGATVVALLAHLLVLTVSAGSFARGFSITGPKDCRELTIRDPRDQTILQRIQVVTEETSCSGIDGFDFKIHLPITKVYAESTSLLPFFERLGAGARVLGTSLPHLVSSPFFRKRIQTKKFSESPAQLQAGDLRLVFSKPQGGPSAIITMEYREPHPLGYAEWIKVIGLLMGKGALAHFYFDQMASSYLHIQRIAKEAKTAPAVLLNSVHGENWPLPGGDSWWGNLIEHAGGNYLYSHLRGVSVLLSPSQVEIVLPQVDVWLNPVAFSCERLLEEYPQAKSSEALQKRQVYTRKRPAQGGDDWYESGLANPDLVLHELVSVLHPNLLKRKYSKWFLPLSEVGE